MSQIFNLDNVIRLVKGENEEKKAEGLDTGKLIRIDARKGEIIYKKPLIPGLSRREIRYYRVSSHNRAENSTECTFRDFSNDQSITINIKYEVNCPPGNEEKVVLALYKGSNPGSMLNQLIGGWLNDFTGKIRDHGRNPVLEYYNYSAELKQTIKENVYKYTGLKIELLLTLKHESELKTEKVNSNYFAIRIKDYEGELNLKFESGLAVNNENKIYAILNYNQLSKMERLMTEHIQKTILESIALHDFIYSLKGHVNQKITGELNSILLKHGRQIAWLNFESEITNIYPEQSGKIDHLVECDIKGYSGKIKIHHKLLMQLEDLGKYKAKKITGSLEEMIRKELDKVTQNVLFDKTYVDILLDFEEDENARQIVNKIKSNMQDFLKSIGYSVKHLMVEPDEEPLILRRDGFLVEKKDSEFATNDSRVNVKFDVVARGKLKDLRKIAKYIVPDKSIKEEMMKLVLKEIEKKMHEIEPEVYFMPDNFPDREPVIVELMRVAQEKLEETFFAEEVYITIKPVSNELVNIFQQLKNGGPYRFNIKITPLRESGYSDEVEFQIEYLIINVNKNGWQTFLSRQSETIQTWIKKIEETISLNLTQKFKDTPSAILLANDISIKKKLIQTARYSQSKVAFIFGLDILISEIVRLPTERELANRDVRKKQIEEQKNKEIKMIGVISTADQNDLEQLLTKRSELINPDCPDDEALEEVEREIEKIQKKSAHPENTGQKILKQGTKNTVKEWDFNQYEDEFSGNPLLSAGKQSPKGERSQGEEQNE